MVPTCLCLSLVASACVVGGGQSEESLAKCALAQKMSVWPSFKVLTRDQPLGSKPPNWNANVLVPGDTFLLNCPLSKAPRGVEPDRPPTRSKVYRLLTDCNYSKIFFKESKRSSFSLDRAAPRTGCLRRSRERGWCAWMWLFGDSRGPFVVLFTALKGGKPTWGHCCATQPS